MRYQGKSEAWRDHVEETTGANRESFDAGWDAGRAAMRLEMGKTFLAHHRGLAEDSLTMARRAEGEVAISFGIEALTQAVLALGYAKEGE